MDGFELNKIAGAVLAALLVMAGGNTLLQIAMPNHAPHKQGWNLPVTATTAVKPGEAAKAFDPAPVLAMLPKASADNGADVFKKCMSCHNANKGGTDLVGPNLWGVVGRKVGSSATFGSRYSDAIKSHGGEWSFELLAKYLHNPAKTIPDNKMIFAGVTDETDLADLLTYLRKQSDNPVVLPK